jgi:hypothetical protein
MFVKCQENKASDKECMHMQWVQGQAVIYNT